MNSLVLVYTPFNKLIVKTLMDQGVISRNSLIVDHTEVESSDFANYIHLANKWRKVRFIFQIRFLRSFVFEKHFITNVFIPHADGVASNILVKMVKSMGKFDLNLYHEGILSLYNDNENPKSIKWSKYLLALLFLYIHDYKADLFPIDIAKSFYTPFDKNSSHIPIHKVTRFKLPDFKFNDLTKNDLLFIGQPNYYEEFGPGSGFKDALLKLIYTSNIDTVLYKPHPFEKNYLIDSKDFDNITILDKNVSIETMASQLAPKIVVSGLSSALTHLNAGNPDVAFYSIVPKGSDICARPSIIKIFEEMGIIIIN